MSYVAVVTNDHKLSGLKQHWLSYCPGDQKSTINLIKLKGTFSMAAFLPESLEDNQFSCLFQFLLSIHIPWFTATFLCLQSATLQLLFSLPPFLFWCWPSLLLLLSCSVVSNTLWPCGLQHARLPCPPPSPGVCSNSCPLSQWCHLTISSSVVHLSSCPQSCPASGSIPVSWLFTFGGQSIGVSASVLPVNIQG